MKRFFILALAVFALAALANQAQAHGPQVQFGFRRGFNDRDAFNAGRRFEQRRQFQFRQQFNGHQFRSNQFRSNQFHGRSGFFFGFN